MELGWSIGVSCMVRIEVRKRIDNGCIPAICGQRKSLAGRVFYVAEVSLNQRVDGSSPSGGTRKSQHFSPLWQPSDLARLRGVRLGLQLLPAWSDR